MKLFVSDLDGTLLDEGHGVSVRNIAALQALKEHGFTLVIATGRSFSSVEELGLLHLDPYVIALNGAQIYTPEKQLCFRAPLVSSKVPMIYSYCEAQSISYIVYTEVAMYLYRPKKFMDLLFHMAKKHAHNEEEFVNCLQEAYDMHCDLPIFDDAIRKRLSQGLETVYKIEVCHYDPEVFTHLEEQLDDTLSISSSWPTNREITSVNVHKGNALKTLCEVLNCNIKDCIAIGDSRNDMELLQVAGFSIAMENASDALKQHCDYVTSSCANSGVADAIDYIIKQLR